MEDLCSARNFFLQHIDGKFHLKKNHDYYHQIQGQFHVTRRLWCDFVVWTPLGVPPCSPSALPSSRPSYTPVTVERIHVDNEFWIAKIYPKLVDFYMRHLLLEMASPRHLSGQVIREHVPFDYSPTSELNIDEQ